MNRHRSPRRMQWLNSYGLSAVACQPHSRSLTGDILLENVKVGVDLVEQSLRVMIRDQDLPLPSGNGIKRRSESCIAVSDASVSAVQVGRQREGRGLARPTRPMAPSSGHDDSRAFRSPRRGMVQIHEPYCACTRQSYGLNKRQDDPQSEQRHGSAVPAETPRAGYDRVLPPEKGRPPSQHREISCK